MFEFICHERAKSVKYVRILQEWGVRGKIVSTIRLPRYPRKGTLFPLAMPSGGVRRREGGLIRAGGAFNFTFVCCCRKAAFHLGVWGGEGEGEFGEEGGWVRDESEIFFSISQGSRREQDIFFQSLMFRDGNEICKLIS